jgi:class 3 adenylate cyclase
VSISVGLRTGLAGTPRPAEIGSPARDARDTDRRAGGVADAGGALRPISLRFFDHAIERRYQQVSGAESLTGFLITTGAASVLWLLAAIVLPTGTPIPMDRAVIVCCAVASLNFGAFLSSNRLVTLDRQHAVLSFITSVNGMVVLWLASTGGILPGYGISAIMLLFAFGFVSRTGFVFAAARSAVVVGAFVLAALHYAGPPSLEVDALILGAAVAGTLVALRLLETSRRRVFYQDIVITRQADALRVEKERADGLLGDMLPASISARLLEGERTIADTYPAVTVLFADIVGFTPLAGRLPPDEVVALLDRLFARFDELVTDRGLEKIKTIGDAYMAAAGLHDARDDDPARVVDLGLAMIEAARLEGGPLADLRLRVGVHSGSVIGGVIGHRKFAFDIWGETVNIASRLESQGLPGRVHVSAGTWAAVKDAFQAEPARSVEIRGYGPMETYAIVGPG